MASFGPLIKNVGLAPALRGIKRKAKRVKRKRWRNLNVNVDRAADLYTRSY